MLSFEDVKISRRLLDLNLGQLQLKAEEWGSFNVPRMLLIHGGAAHRRWWDLLSPYLAKHRRVIAIDLSGHGESAFREAYSIETWSEEIVAWLQTQTETVELVGHSLGGLIGLAAVQKLTELGELGRVSSLQCLDAPIGPKKEDPNADKKRLLSRLPHRAALRDELLERYRLFPTQPSFNPEAERYLAFHGIKEEGDGLYKWSFDPKLFVAPRADSSEWWKNSQLPLRFVRAEMSSVVEEERARWLKENLPENSEFIELSGAYHHFLVDDPKRCAEVILRDDEL